MQFKIQIEVDGKWETFTWEQLNAVILFGNDFSSNRKRLWSGLKDKNGVEIYEGDVIWLRRKMSNGDRDYLCEVRYKQQGACFHFVCGKFFIEPISCAQHGDGESVWCENVWVEGNVYEHPHLLNQGTGTSEAATERRNEDQSGNPSLETKNN